MKMNWWAVSRSLVFKALSVYLYKSFYSSLPVEVHDFHRKISTVYLGRRNNLVKLENFVLLSGSSEQLYAKEDNVTTKNVTSV